MPFALLLLLPLAGAQEPAWPADGDWSAVTDPNGWPVGDALDVSGNHAWLDLVGSFSDPAGYHASSDAWVWFRLRLAADPRDGDDWRTRTWVVLIESDRDTTSGTWDHAVVLDGRDAALRLVENTIPRESWCEDPGSPLGEWSADPEGSGPARVVEAPTSLGAPGMDSFLDLRVSATVLTDTVGTGDPTRWHAVLAAGNDIDSLWDVAGTSCAASWLVAGGGISDRDSDGLYDFDEIDGWGTDPDYADTDHDGLSDGEEVLAVGSDPLDPDTDDDTLLDSDEDRNGDGFVTGDESSPLSPDTDDDGLCDHLRFDAEGDGLDLGGVCVGSELDLGTHPARADTDGGGVADGVEVLADGTEPIATPADDRLDTDGDGIFDWVEVHVAHTRPDDADTDDDGLLDGEEAGDANGVLDPGETDPADPDTDGDGLCDGLRIDGDGDGLDPVDACAGSEVAAGTDPRLADTDGGGRTDAQEVLVDGTDPLDGNDDRVDSDADGLLDREEILIGSDPLDADTDSDDLRDGDEVHVHGTDPLHADTDGGGIDDGDEVTVDGTDPLDPADDRDDPDADGLVDPDEAHLGTDPLRFDTDGDTLGDGDEVDLHGTNPLLFDTDGDGIDDGTEVRTGTDPLRPETVEDAPPDPRSCGCATGSGSAGGAWLVLVLGLVVRRRGRIRPVARAPRSGSA